MNLQSDTATGGRPDVGGNPKPKTIRDALQLYTELHLPTLAHAQPVRTRIRKYFDTIAPIDIDKLTTVDVQRWHLANMTRSRQQANSSLALLRALYKKLAEWDFYHGMSPAHCVKMKRPLPRNRYVTPHELSALLRVLACEEVMTRLFFSIVLFVGCRPGEAERLEWSHLKLWTDPESGVPFGTWRKPRTKNGLAHSVPLPPMIARLAAEHRENVPPGCAWVFPGRDASVSRSVWHILWTRIRQAAGIPDVRRHDLRRTCATYLLDGGMDLLTLSKAVMNHTDLRSTSVYAQPLESTVRAQLAKNSERMMAYAFSSATGGVEQTNHGQG